MWASLVLSLFRRERRTSFRAFLHVWEVNSKLSVDSDSDSFDRTGLRKMLT